MIGYVLDNMDLSIKDILEFENYSFSEDIEYANKSTITVTQKPNIENDDFVICKDNGETVFIGICEDFSSTSEEASYTITMLQKESLFDRDIFVGTTSVIASTGIEDFIKAEIEANWISSGDTLLDKDYITVTCSTHTPLNITVSDDAVYNLKTFLGNAKQYYGIFLDYTFTSTTLAITVRKDSAAALPIDVTLNDISNYSEVYNVDVLTKLLIKWLNTSTSTVTNLSYYLKADRTITTSSSDPDRAKGITKSIYIESDSADDVLQKAVDEFKGNAYEHKISFDLHSDSNVYPPSMYYVGRNATIKTKTGKQTSLITGMSRSSESSFVSFVFGTLKVSLIEKIRSKKW